MARGGDTNTAHKLGQNRSDFVNAFRITEFLIGERYTMEETNEIAKLLNDAADDKPGAAEAFVQLARLPIPRSWTSRAL